MIRYSLSVGLAALTLSACAPTLAQPASAPDPDTENRPTRVLFIGNSFTFGATSAALGYRADTVTDLNGDRIGGVPALFKLFTEEAGLNYSVSLETSPGKTLKWHWQNRHDVVDRAWDHVVMQEYSVLDPEDPGNPEKLIDYSDRFARLFEAANRDVDVSLTATWSRPDQTYPADGHWHGQPIQSMALDLRRGYDRAAQQSDAVDRVNPVGQAFNCAIEAGIADPNPYDGIGYDQIDLWGYDHYHAGTPGYYLEALTVFVGITGRDPRSLGPQERAAAELGLSPNQAVRLQKVAWANAQGESCGELEDR